MPAPTDQQLLDEVKSAILEIVQGRGASYTIGGRQYTALDLDKLRSLEGELRARISRRRTGMFQQGTFGGC